MAKKKTLLKIVTDLRETHKLGNLILGGQNDADIPSGLTPLDKTNLSSGEDKRCQFLSQKRTGSS